MKRIHLRINELLKERNMTQSQLAALSDIRPNAISNLSRGYIDRLSLDHVAKIAEALDISDMNEILVITDEEKTEGS